MIDGIDISKDDAEKQVVPEDLNSLAVGSYIIPNPKRRKFIWFRANCDRSIITNCIQFNWMVVCIIRLITNRNVWIIHIVDRQFSKH